MLLQIINLRASLSNTQGMVVNGVPESKMCWFRGICIHAVFLKTSAITTKFLWNPQRKELPQAVSFAGGLFSQVTCVPNMMQHYSFLKTPTV
jgi:hypothetical protein